MASLAWLKAYSCLHIDIGLLAEVGIYGTYIQMCAAC